jgi:hypothetical protein
MEAFMKRLVLVIGLILTVCFGFAKESRVKSHIVSTYIGETYEDGRIKYSLDLDEAFDQNAADQFYYFYGMSKIKPMEKTSFDRVYIMSAKFFIVKNDNNTIELVSSYNFVYSDKTGIPFDDIDKIIDKLGVLSEDGVKEIEDDPIFMELQKL